MNYYSYCTLGFDRTSWVWFIWQRHCSCICVVLCTSGLSHTCLMTPVFLGELWVRLASLKPASFDTWKGAGHSLSRAPQTTVKHSENRFVALSHMTWLEDAKVKRPWHHGCWHDPSRAISHNYLDSFLSSGSIHSRILALNTPWKQLRSEHLYMLFIICVWPVLTQSIGAWKAEGSRFKPQCGQNLGDVLLVGAGARTPSKHHQGTPVQGTGPQNAHIRPWISRSVSCLLPYAAPHGKEKKNYW